MEVTYIWSKHLLFENLIRIGGVLLFIAFFILIAGFLLYILLKPPVDIKEEAAVMELRFELKLSSINLPENSENQLQSCLKVKEE
jgi:hypothetical protein